MITLSRIEKSLLAGVLAGAAATWFEAHRRHAALAAAAARAVAHGQHLSTTSILTAGFIATTVIVSLVVFITATIYARRRAAGLASPRRPRRGHGDYSDHGDGW